MTKTKYIEIVNQIKEKYKISDYLGSRGIFQTSTGKDLKYICPLHNEKTPSFFIYIGEEGYEMYHCFGCLVSGNVISLKAAIENKSFQETIQELGGDIDISDKSELELICRQLKEDIDDKKSKEGFKELFSKLSVNFSSLGYEHLKSTDFDEKTIEDFGIGYAPDSHYGMIQELKSK